MKRKIIGIVLAFLMVFSTCSGAVVAAEDESGNISEEPIKYPNIYIPENGKMNQNENHEGLEYLKTDADGWLIETTAEDAWNVHWDEATYTLTLRNLNLTDQLDNPDITVFDMICIEASVGEGQVLTLAVEGVNTITAKKGSALSVIGDFNITGMGTLNLITTSGELKSTDPENETGYFIPHAAYINGAFQNSAVVRCESKNEDGDMFIEADIWDIANTGTVSGKIAYWGGGSDGLVPPDTKEPDTGRVYVGRAYYFTSDLIYPNQILLTVEDERVMGNYDASGYGIPSQVYYQDYWLLEDGSFITDDFPYPCIHLVYGENPEAQVRENDVVHVLDGKKHTINQNLYSAGVTNGELTVNGNVVNDCFGADMAVRTDVDEKTGNAIYERDKEGKIVYDCVSDANTSLTVNGNVGTASLYHTYKGSLTVNGDVRSIVEYDDVNVKDAEYPDAVFYGSKVNAGTLIKNGKYVNLPMKLDGEVSDMNTMVYKGNVSYTSFVVKKDGKQLVGTTAPIGEDALTFLMTPEGLPNDTFPLVQEANETQQKKIRDMLTLPDSKLLVMDIQLIQSNTKEVEPSKEVLLYIQNLTGFKNPALYHVVSDDMSKIEKVWEFDEQGAFDGTIQAKTDSYSIYFIAENQELKQTAQNTSDKTEDASTTATDSKGTTATDSKGTTATDSKGTTVASPKTGDEHALFYVFGMMAVSSVLMIGLNRKKR